MKIYSYILRNHIAPFIFSIFIVISVLLLQFLMRFAERLIGKGLDFWIIIQLIVYNLAWMVVLVVPMSVLIATLMGFGNMSQNNEVAIMKSSGMSLYRMMAPVILASMVVAYLLIQFNNYVYPNANYSARVLMQDISQKKPTLSLVPGVFSQEIPNYSILARDIDRNTNRLVDLTIYDYSDPSYINIVTANSGNIYFSGDQEKLMLDLYEGEIHTSDLVETENYRKLVFDRHRIALPAEQFLFRQTVDGSSRGDRELGAPEMFVIVDSLKDVRDRLTDNYKKDVNEFFTADSVFMQVKRTNAPLMKHSYLRVENKLRSINNNISSKLRRLETNKTEINRYMVEIHKKYSLPFACIIFVMIGAPLGTMVRKGGVGVAAGISLLFFLVYWAFLIGGEKLADRGMLNPFWGMWSANFFFALLGVFFTYRAAKERVNINFDFLLKLIPKQFRKSGDHEDS